MSMGLDLGTYGFRSLRRNGEQLVVRACRSLYSVLPDSQAHRRLLEQAGVQFGECENSLILMGDPADELAELFQNRSRALFSNGTMPDEDPLDRQVTASLMESLLPQPEIAGEVCCMNLPGSGSSSSAKRNRDFEFLTRIVRLRGYAPRVMGAGLALVLAELVGQAFTGIGITFGASDCCITLAHRGVEIAGFHVPIGGDWIDDKLARRAGVFEWSKTGEHVLDPATAQKSKHTTTESLGDEFQQLLLDLHRDLISQVVRAAISCLSQSTRLQDVTQPLQIVCSGGTTRYPHFQRLLDECVQAQQWPLDIVGPIKVVDADETIARGCLISAELEGEALKKAHAT